MKEETMEYCFQKLNPRILSTVEHTDCKRLFETLKQIKTPTLVTGVGGSSVVAEYCAKVLRRKNNIIAQAVFPRDLVNESLTGYENVVACSYSGNNIGVRASFENNLKHYLFSANEKDGCIPLKYDMRDEEISFVSVAGTLAPMALLFLYYTDGNLDLLKEILNEEYIFDSLPQSEVYEILRGGRNTTAATILESTIVEGGIGSAVMHEKYNYCHGRCQLHTLHDSALIYLDEKSELDTLMKREFDSFYEKKAILSGKYEDEVIDDFYMTVKSLWFLKSLAEAKGRDLSLKRVKEISEVFYTYRGGM